MSAPNDGSRILRLLMPENPVMRARNQQFEEDLRALEGRDHERDTLQALLDLYTLLDGRRRDRHPLERYLGVQKADGPSEAERRDALQRLANRLAGIWKFYDGQVAQAARSLVARRGTSVSAVKRGALKHNILVTLAEATEPQEVRLGHDKAMAAGSRLVLRQKKDLDALENGKVTDELIRKLSASPVGVQAYEFWREVGLIEAVMRGDDPWMAIPADLRPSAFLDWASTRTIYHAEAWLLEHAGLDSTAPRAWKRYEIGGDEVEDETAPRSDQLPEIVVLRQLDREAPEPLTGVLQRERLAEVLEAATPSQQEVLRLLQEHLANGLTQAEAIEATAKDRCVSVNAIHQTLARVRTRV